MSIASYPAIVSIQDARMSVWRQLGELAIRDGQVAVLVLAGGQGTRLGFNGPKGLYPLGPPVNQTVFQLQAERIRQLSPMIRWYIMTSSATHTETMTYFQRNQNFGLNVTFFQQADEPSKFLDGSPIPGTTSPNGNGDVYAALNRNGILEQLHQHGIKWVFMYCVDNVLCRLADPILIGYAIDERLECAIKVVTKRHPDEKLGSLVLTNGHPEIIEYTEIPAELKSNLMDGTICIQLMTVEFLQTAATVELPRHYAHKKIKCPDGTWVDGIKSEKFIFDAFPLARLGALRVHREHEFSPLKNATGADSPETCQRDLCRELNLTVPVVNS
jgi:UDP-N-acetylglucosamine/UDP-N-acetylgalactosamine diphosphorylase